MSSPVVRRPSRTDAMLAAATLRAAENRSSCPLFTDPFVEPLLQAAAARGWQPGPCADGGPLAAYEAYVACRTRWFDEHFIAAGARGVDQAVIMASGLDTRPWRLPWLSSSAIVEIDHHEVLDFKCAARDGRRAEHAAAQHCVVPADPRTDWSMALQEAGFDGSEPAAWSLEGVLPDWSSDDRTAAVRLAAELSRPASRLAVEIPEAEADALCAQLCGLGWQVAVERAQTLMDRYSRCVPDDAVELTPRRAFLCAVR